MICKKMLWLSLALDVPNIGQKGRTDVHSGIITVVSAGKKAIVRRGDGASVIGSMGAGKRRGVSADGTVDVAVGVNLRVL